MAFFKNVPYFHKEALEIDPWVNLSESKLMLGKKRTPTLFESFYSSTP
jgi:hypothetical protein